MTGTDEISRRLAAGESFEQIILAMMPASAQHALRRCALAAGFDEDSYQAVLRGSDGPSLADLQRSRSVEPRPGSTGEFRVSSTLQAAAWSLWWSEAGLTPGSADVPPELAAFGRRFAEYCRTAGRQLEALRALVVGDQDAAAELLAEQYAQADAEHDLARCHDLLAVLSEPHLAAVVGPQLAVLRNDLSRYLNARSMWHDALLASSRYLTRPGIERHVTGLLEPGGPRALRLDASGGMGKTTTLQWFIAHHCVPRRIACALVDLDAVDPVNATRHPWLVLLEIAAQLDVQLDGAPFQELLRARLVPLGPARATTGDRPVGRRRARGAHRRCRRGRRARAVPRRAGRGPGFRSGARRRRHRRGGDAAPGRRPGGAARRPAPAP